MGQFVMYYMVDFINTLRIPISWIIPMGPAQLLGYNQLHRSPQRRLPGKGQAYEAWFQCPPCLQRAPWCSIWKSLGLPCPFSVPSSIELGQLARWTPRRG